MIAKAMKELFYWEVDDMPLKRNMDIWKRYMLRFQWIDNSENETYYFDTKEEMLKFVKENKVAVTKMFYLEDVEL